MPRSTVRAALIRTPPRSPFGLHGGSIMRKSRSPEASDQLLHRWLRGDELAAAELWRRYEPRLIGLARKNLTGDMARQFDPEDVVQSVYLKFFSAARSNIPGLKHGDDLWPWLVAIMRNKLRDEHKGQHAQKRKADNVEVPQPQLAHVEDRQPTPGEQAALTDELHQLLQTFPDSHRRMVALRLENWKVEEIASVTHTHERTVRRVLKRAQQYLRNRDDELKH